jgi:hypothetical protein
MKKEILKTVEECMENDEMMNDLGNDIGIATPNPLETTISTTTVASFPMEIPLKSLLSLKQFPKQLSLFFLPNAFLSLQEDTILIPKAFDYELAKSQFIEYCVGSSVSLILKGPAEMRLPLSYTHLQKKDRESFLTLSSCDEYIKALQEPILWEDELITSRLHPILPDIPSVLSAEQENRILVFTLIGDDVELVTSSKLRLELERLAGVDWIWYHPKSPYGAVLFKSNVASSLLDVVFHQGNHLQMGLVEIVLEKTTSQVEWLYFNVMNRCKKSIRKEPIQFKKVKGKKAVGLGLGKRSKKKKNRVGEDSAKAASMMDLLEQFKL